MGLAGLRHASTVQRLIGAAVAPATERAYRGVWNRLRIFLDRPQSDALFPVSAATAADYLASRHEQGCCASTLATEASAISYGHKLAGVTDPTTDFRVRQLLNGARRLRPSRDARLALSLAQMEQLCGALNFLALSPLDRLAFRAIFCLAFFALLRPGEVVLGRDTAHTVRLGHVRLVGQRLSITVPSSKTATSPFHTSFDARPDMALCPVAAVRDYLAVRGAGSPADILFVGGDRRPVTTRGLTRVLRLAGRQAGLDASRLSGHCLRLSGASHGAAIGMTDIQLRQAGRWSSQAVQRYVRRPVSLLQAS